MEQIQIFKKRKVLYSVVVLIIVMALIFIFFIKGRDRRNTAKSNAQEVEKEDANILADVKVKVDRFKKPHTLLLEVDNIPSGTNSVEYEITYETLDKGIQGVMGNVSSSEFKNNSFKRDILFGTCSAGKCVYHKVKGKIELSLTFVGSYGRKSLVKNF